MFRWHVVSAVFWRNVKQYFSGVLGYLFIVVFVTVCAVMAFSPRFFADNLANLDQLSRWFPMLLLFFVPAITMSTWADERRQGTDSILFTLPASDFDILLGKYLAVAAVYTVALLFSMTQLIVLQLIGNPDWGVIFTTYVGYWLAGISLLAVGMFASSLTSSATVAFVLGNLFCAIPVLIGHYFRGFVGLERLGFDWNLRDFTIGLIPLSSVLYFVSLTIVMLYLNLIVISQRHWNRGQQSTLATQFAIRAASLAIGLIAFNYLCDNAISSTWSRVDLTNEKLYTLNSTTTETLNKAKELEREITIQAFISEDVPRKFVPARKQFVGLLRQYDDYGGQNIDVRYVYVKPNSQKEVDAQYLGITPVDDRSDVGGRTIEQQVYLGANIASAAGEVTLPFVGEGASIEYELSRSIATVLDESQRLNVGILETDARFGGFEYNERRIDWAYTTTMEELNKQFEIDFIRPEALEDMLPEQESNDNADEGDSQNSDGSEDKPQKKLKPAPDVLLVADPASLSDPGIDVLVRYIEAGHPAVILADPLPFFWAYQYPIGLGIINAPRMPRVPQQSRAAQVLVASPLPKHDQGRATRLLDALGIEWDNGQAVWSVFNPHPAFKGTWRDEMGDRWPEYYGDVDKAYVFVRNHGGTEAFNPDDSISSELSELLMFYPGSVAAKEGSDLKFTPLASIGTESGTTPWESLTLTPEQETRYIDPRTGRMTTEKEPARSDITMGNLIVLDPQPSTQLDNRNHVVAARIQGQSDDSVDVVFITDLDFVTDLYPDHEEAIGTKLDNLAFLQNAIEVLAGNEDFVRLRNRKIKPRTLVKLESVIEEYRAARTQQQSEAEKKIRDELAAEQAKLDKAAEKIEGDQSLSFFEKLQKTSQEASDAQRRFDLRKKKLDRQLSQEITELENEEQSNISRLENFVRYASIFAAPLPAFLLGAWVLLNRRKNEEKNIAPERRVAG